MFEAGIRCTCGVLVEVSPLLIHDLKLSMPVNDWLVSEKMFANTLAALLVEFT